VQNQIKVTPRIGDYYNPLGIFPAKVLDDSLLLFCNQKNLGLRKIYNSPDCSFFISQQSQSCKVDLKCLEYATIMVSFRLLGSHFKQSSLSDLESVFLTPIQVQHFFESIPEHIPIQGLVILNTCNRVEWYMVTPEPDAISDWIKSSLACIKGISLDQVSAIMRLYPEQESIHHLFSVSAGLESLVLGETEILNQI